MAGNLSFLLEGNEINPPQNWQETSFAVNFDRDGNARTRIVSENYDFVRENARFFIDRVYNGASGGKGILQSPTYQVKLKDELVYDGYIDMTKDATFSYEKASVKSVERKSIEWLEAKADGFTFESLKVNGEITNNDYAFVPYTKDQPDEARRLFEAIITFYVVLGQIKDQIQKAKDLLSELSSVTGAIAAILKAVLLAAYLITLFTAIVRVIKDFYVIVIQPVKFHACMNWLKLLQKGAAHLGLTVSSSILNSPIYSKAYIMPEKYRNPPNEDDKRILGFTIPKKDKQDGFFKGTFGDLLRLTTDHFNAKIVIRDDVLYLERVDKLIFPPQYILPPVLKYQPDFKTNADEFKSNYLISYQTDSIEKNTFQEFKGTSYQVILKPIDSNDRELSMMQGLEEYRFPLALAKRKTELSVPEQIVKGFLDVLSAIVNTLITGVNALISGINQIIKTINKVIKALDTIGIKINFQVPTIPTLNTINLGNIIENRINMMKLETDFTSVPKVFLMDIGSQPKFNKLSAGNETYLSAKYLWENFHHINSWLPSVEKPTGNQYIIHSVDNIRFGFDDYQKVKNVNTIDVGGVESITQEFKWNEWDEKASITFRIPTLLTTNLAATYIEPDGK